MRKNWLARAEVNVVRRGTRSVFAVAGRWFRARPVVPDSAFQDEGEPYPGHWRQAPEPWPPSRPETAHVLSALEELPATWRKVLVRHDGPNRGPAGPAGPADVDAAVAGEFGLTVDQERDILTQARAALRDRLAPGRETGTR
jgi:hypothetical protein